MNIKEKIIKWWKGDIIDARVVLVLGLASFAVGFFTINILLLAVGILLITFGINWKHHD
jgi:uncharacterized membrane protein